MLMYNTTSPKGMFMNRRLVPTLLSVAVGLALGGTVPAALPVAQGADLSEVYQQALRNDPQLREAEATRLAALEAKPQALSALLPQVTAGGNYSKDQSNGSQVAFIGQGLGTYTSESDLTNKGWNLTLRQSLFKWDNWAALKQADSQVAQAEVDYRAAQQQLVLRTAEAYFNVLAARDTLTAAQSALEAIARPVAVANRAIADLKEFASLREENARLREENARLLAWQTAARRGPAWPCRRPRAPPRASAPR